MPDNKKLIKNLFGAVQDALFFGDPLATRNIGILMNPGQFVSTNLTQNSASDDMAIQADIANQLFDTSFVYAELLGSVSSVYHDVLHHAALPYAPLTPDVLKEMNEIENWLANNQPAYDMYSDRYYDAVEAYEQERCSQNPNGGKLAKLDQKKKSAFQNWLTFGHKQTYENKVGRYINLTDEDPSGMWGRLQNQMQNNGYEQSPNLGPYYKTFLHPAVSSWNSASTSWSRFEKVITEADSYQYSHETSWSAGVSGGWGLWSWGGGTSGSSSYKHQTSSNSDVRVSFDYLRVRLQRPWILEDVFGYRFWTWKKTFGGTLLSDGGNFSVTPPTRPVGRMPVLPKYLIVARNLEISSVFTSQEESWYHKEISANANIGWGPFSLSGSYKDSTSTHRAHASFDGTTFKIDQPQIIAKQGIILDRSPNPDVSLPWQADAWFPSRSDFLSARQQRLTDYQSMLRDELSDILQHEANEVSDAYVSQRQKQLEDEVEQRSGFYKSKK